MAQEALVGDVKTLLRKLQETDGPVALLMLVAPYVASERLWDMVVSARGLDSRGTREAIHCVAELLRQTVNKDDLGTITSVDVRRTDDPFVQAMNGAYRVQESDILIFNATILTVEIEKAILVQSQKAAA